MAGPTEAALAFVRHYAEVVHEHKSELTKLDSAIGDADHGENLDRGFQAALTQLPDDDAGADAVLKAVAMALVSKVGGAAGPLYGTAFLRASAALGEHEQLDGPAVLAALVAGEQGVIQRGKAEVGDKTILDAWRPGIEALEAALDEGASCPDALDRAAEAAEAGMADTIPLVARKGRASYLGERSAGHQDPGATSTALLFRALADTARAHADD
ncbi:dihydroxyacetone kinase subunit L [Egibacter rhizosphaerae]|uniref:Dihydroxyacetone kinase subunit L n=1 Tax=Egibacter rhizosphaerae TaxID=1670831 RepID=A0A411YHF2_9ACTN|nr:dihydroxyacetone kinase subunit DhaL [Egibacter rhizosphaerae]QBI20670.1 dihydroxyacetone kinase subunit L [Egibacter rhizosphaerae]